MMHTRIHALYPNFAETLLKMEMWHVHGGPRNKHIVVLTELFGVSASFSGEL